MWRSSAAYVALTRHKEDVQIFASRETVRGMEKEPDRVNFDQAAASATLDPAQQAAARNARDLDLMAEGLARTDNKRAASAYQIDDAQALRLGFGEAANITDRQSIIYDPELGSRIVTNAAAEAQEQAEGVEVAESTANAPTEAQEPAEGLSTGEALGNAVDGAAQLAEGVASFAEKALDAVAGLLEGLAGGGSTPAPKKAPEPEPKRKLTMKEFLAEEQAQRTAKLAAIKQQIESGQSVTQEDLNSLPAEQTQTRDRGGGISR